MCSLGLWLVVNLKPRYTILIKVRTIFTSDTLYDYTIVQRKRVNVLTQNQVSNLTFHNNLQKTINFILKT